MAHTAGMQVVSDDGYELVEDIRCTARCERQWVLWEGDV